MQLHTECPLDRGSRACHVQLGGARARYRETRRLIMLGHSGDCLRRWAEAIAEFLRREELVILWCAPRMHRLDELFELVPVAQVQGYGECDQRILGKGGRLSQLNWGRFDARGMSNNVELELRVGQRCQGEQ
jgi:hypothetical protein